MPIRIRIQNTGYLHDTGISLFVMQDVTGHVTGLALTAVNKVGYGTVLPYYIFFFSNVLNSLHVLVITN